jgi:predicted MFS family arabinose efflux permease
VSRHDPETGCALIMLVGGAAIIVVDLLVGALIDWRLPILWHVAAAIIVLVALILLELDSVFGRK